MVVSYDLIYAYFFEQNKLARELFHREMSTICTAINWNIRWWRRIFNSSELFVNNSMSISQHLPGIDASEFHHKNIWNSRGPLMWPNSTSPPQCSVPSLVQVAATNLPNWSIKLTTFSHWISTHHAMHGSMNHLSYAAASATCTNN